MIAICVLSLRSNTPSRLSGSELHKIYVHSAPDQGTFARSAAAFYNIYLCEGVLIEKITVIGYETVRCIGTGEVCIFSWNTLKEIDM